MNTSNETKPSLVSPQFLVLVAVGAYFVYAAYEVIVSINFASYLIQNFSTLSGLMQMPWWTATFYSSELGGGVASFLRFTASILALYCAVFYWRRGSSAWPLIKRKVAAALAFEAGYFLLFIPSAWLGFAFAAIGGNVWYFEVTPVWEVFFVAGVACLAMVLALPPVLFKLRSLVMHEASNAELLKWSSIAVVAYLFVVFWFNATMQWAGMIATWGPSMVLNPMDFAGFATSVFGLFLIATFALSVAYPSIKKMPNPLSQTRVGWVSVTFGGYFLLSTAIYFLAGGYEANRSAWYEMIFPHNPYLWCLIFLFVGAPLVLNKVVGRDNSKESLKGGITSPF